MPVTEPQPSESIGSDSAIWHRHDHDARVGARVGHVAHVLRKNLFLVAAYCSHDDQSSD